MKKFISVGLIAIAATIFFTWPLLLRVNSYYQEIGDWALNSWILWYSQESILSGRIVNLFSYYNAPMFYPSALSLAFSEHLLVPSLLFLPFYQLTHNLVFSTNIFVLLTFVFTFLSSFYFLYYLLKQKLPAIVGAIFYTFNPYISEHLLAGHLQLLSRYFLPLLFLTGIKYFMKPNLRNALIFVIIFILNSLSSIYFQNFSIIGLAVVFAIIATYQYQKIGFLYIKTFLRSFLIIIPFLLLLLCFEFPYMQYSYLESVKRGVVENMKHSGRLLDWIFTLPENQLYGEFVRKFAEFRGANLNSIYFFPERVLFPTITGIVLAILGLYGVFKKRVFKPRVISISLIVLLIVSGLLTLGPSIYIYHGFSLPNPLFDFVYYTSPLLQATRVPARFTFILYLPFSFFIAAGFQYIENWTKRFSHPKLLVAITFTVLCAWFIESQVSWPWNLKSNIIESLRFYQSSSKSPFGIITNKKTVHYPLHLDALLYDAKYLTWATFTGEILFNGYSGFTPREWLLLAKQLDIVHDQNSYTRLRAIGIDFLIIHKDEYKRQGLELPNPLTIQSLVSFEDSNLLILDLSKFPSPVICSYDPNTKISSSDQENLVFKNDENCYFTAKYENKYIKHASTYLRLPILLEPKEEVAVSVISEKSFSDLMARLYQR